MKNRNFLIMIDEGDTWVDCDVASYFTKKDGQYLCARWARPIAPVIFGVDEQSLALFKGAIEALVGVSGHQMSDVDPEIGANVMMFFCADWGELLGVENLEHLVPELADVVARLKQGDANQYRIFRVDEEGALRAAFVFIRMDQQLQSLEVEGLALMQAVQVLALWSEQAFIDRPILEVNDEGKMALRAHIVALLRAVYDPSLPNVARDTSHALRVGARMGGLGR